MAAAEPWPHELLGVFDDGHDAEAGDDVLWAPLELSALSWREGSVGGGAATWSDAPAVQAQAPAPAVTRCLDTAHAAGCTRCARCVSNVAFCHHAFCCSDTRG